MTLYERIKSRRESLGLSQEALAIKLGYKDRSTIAKIESGVNDLTQSKISAFAKALETTPAYLMGWQIESDWDSDPQSPPSSGYYLDDEATLLAQEIFERPELRMLMDASRKVSKNDIQFVVDMIERMKKEED